MSRTQDKETTRVIEHLRRRIANLEKANSKDLQETTERGKELVKLTNIIRSCESLIDEAVFEKLMSVVDEFETRCVKIRRKAPPRNR